MTQPITLNTDVYVGRPGSEFNDDPIDIEEAVGRIRNKILDEAAGLALAGFTVDPGTIRIEAKGGAMAANWLTIEMRAGRS